MPSFDVVSKVNQQELTNAISNCDREISTRFDFKGLKILIENNKKENTITIIAPDDLKLKQVDESAKKIISALKKTKIKVQLKIQNDELRASGKKKDDLQESMNLIKTVDIGQPVEFINFRD